MNSTTPAPFKAITEEILARIQTRLKERRERPQRIPPNPPPRYDEVFFRGAQWLDELAAGPDLHEEAEP